MPGKWDPDGLQIPFSERKKAKRRLVIPFRVMTDEEWWQTKRFKRLHDEAVRRNNEYRQQRIMEQDEKPDSLS